jgi:nucleoside-diphosphate-sugar epimerase
MLLKVQACVRNLIGGVDYVIHVASPFHFKVTNYTKDFYEPAIHGTMEILKAASGEKSVKRVVITSSVGAMVNAEKFDPAF